MAKKRLFGRHDIAESTVTCLAQMDRRDFILSVSLIQVGIQQIWDDGIDLEVAKEIIMPLFCIFNEYHPYEEVSFDDTLEVIKVMNITFGKE